MSRAGLDKAMQQVAAQYSIPLMWVHAEGGRPAIGGNGTAFVLDCGAGPFLVTAAHVLDGCQADRARRQDTVCMLGTTRFPLGDRMISSDVAYDVATFRVTAGEVADLATQGKCVLTGSQASWPPTPPQPDHGVFFVGFPGDGRTLLPYRGNNLVEVDWIGYTALASATAVNDSSITVWFEHDPEYDIGSRPAAPPDWALGGCSGAPLLTFIERHGVYSWQLGGVVNEASNRVLRAARADCLEADGTVRSHPDLMAYKRRDLG